MNPRIALVLSSALALLAAGCSKDPDQKTSHADSGTTVEQCLTSDDCPAGDCLGGLCVWCDETSCPAGQWCNHSGRCTGCDGGCASDAAVPADAGKSCLSRADCEGQACIDGACAPAGDHCGSSDECAAGTICSAAGSCIPGCASKADCAGAAAGPRCDLATGQCGPCAENADCDATTQNCIAGACTVAVSCPDGDRAVCGELACVDKLCRPCVSSGDCGDAFDCTAGACVGKTACTTDDQCHTLTLGHWCDAASGMCKWGCLSSPCYDNCCSGGKVCNETTHACEAKVCNNCDNSCVLPATCDIASCSCVTSTGGCSAVDCSCSGGLTCSCPGLLGCVPLQCNTNGTCK